MGKVHVTPNHQNMSAEPTPSSLSTIYSPLLAVSLLSRIRGGGGDQ